jgi:transcriptional regulator with XRE-family HTH domain
MSKNNYSKEYQHLLEQLKKAREDSGLTQKEVSEKLKKPQSYISKCESGERRIDPIELKMFAKVYNQPINFFL